MPDDMRRDFADREELIAYLREQFPEAVEHDGRVSETRGGRAAAEERLNKLKPGRDYELTRDYTHGPVSRLSAYIRHGVVSLAEVRDAALNKVFYPDEADKFINQLAWRDYFQRVYAQIGDDVWKDREPYKTGWRRDQYDDEMPDDLTEARTGLVCMDSFVRELYETGYLHHHARLWLAAYVVHWRRVKWQAGARWFQTHLLDGDPASNALSWQHVASTFSAKPFIFNQPVLERYTEGEYCKVCPLLGHCDFEGSMSRLERKLFPHGDFEQPKWDYSKPGPRHGRKGRRK